MEVKIFHIPSHKLVPAIIRKGRLTELPGMHEGWVFNFGKRLSELRNATAYVLTVQDLPSPIQGCMIFQLKEGISYMAYLEVAPANKGRKKEFEHVAGCLIAFAFRLSLIEKTAYPGMLVFDVFEREKDRARLMEIYSTKYGASRLTESTMIIELNQGLELIRTYLERNA